MNGILKGTGGVYRWYYELNLYKNPVVLFTLWKVFGVITALLWVFITVISLRDYNFIWNGFISNTKFFLLFFIGIELFCLFGYLLYALIMRGKYCVIFEMDKKGIRHIHAPRQFKKAQILSLLAVLAGAASGSPTAAGAGMLSGSKQTQYSDWKQVRSVKSYKRQNLIYVNAPFSKNQVYTEGTDFDFVLEFIKTHTPDAKHICR
jgi:hypothetical protein